MNHIRYMKRVSPALILIPLVMLPITAGAKVVRVEITSRERAPETATDDSFTASTTAATNTPATSVTLSVATGLWNRGGPTSGAVETVT